MSQERIAELQKELDELKSKDEKNAEYRKQIEESKKNIKHFKKLINAINMSLDNLDKIENPFEYIECYGKVSIGYFEKMIQLNENYIEINELKIESKYL